MFTCPNCGAVRRSLLNAMDHADRCKPPAAAPPPRTESVAAYVSRIV